MTNARRPIIQWPLMDGNPQEAILNRAWERCYYYGLMTGILVFGSLAVAVQALCTRHEFLRWMDWRELK